MNRQKASLKRSPSAESISPPPVKRKMQSGTTKSAVANFFKPASQKEPEKLTWRILSGTVLAGRYVPSPKPETTEKGSKPKVALFDFDFTLIATTSGKKFPVNSDDWKWWHACVPESLRRLHDEGFILAIVSNQGGISLKTNNKTAKGDARRLGDFKTKAKNVLTLLDLPIRIFAATGIDQFRKPRPGMWHELLRDLGLKHEDIDLQASIFVGDAAGRDEMGPVQKDFSCSDRGFSENVGIPFKTPEEFFLSQPTRPWSRDFDPKAYLAELDEKANSTTSVEFKKEYPQDIVIFCGAPGAGKSTFYWKHFEPLGYVRINQDILGSRQNCIKKATQHLEDGESVVIDNTNANPETREHWIKLARKFKVPIRCIHFTTPVMVAEHNDVMRALSGEMNPEKRDMLPKVAFSDFKKRYREPQLEEGLQDIIKVDFAFDGTEEQRAIWTKHWVSS
ncbi:putative DNA 3'-phosphatase Tpp1 [Trichodelitschia bisporula]|uniref:Putative DNA 3'-phosphatase Tpp1 n=1 Tax=Trichodelitschia bisporula TaxID=703511 RepID=A0A6G1HSP2_9PEZI|nr:putative DNA 3'-phosphatase Tpp1 [Trichodelitschia bisporula]